MPPLERYDRALPYSYAPGMFPAMEALARKPERVRRLLVSARAEGTEGMAKLLSLCGRHGVRVETADKALQRISGKDNCFAAAVFDKWTDALLPGRHIVLHHIADAGNLGTILRAALGLNYADIAVIRPATDPFDPHTVRACMGAVFSLRLREYGDFEEYRADFPDQALYPFMLDGSLPLREASKAAKAPFSLIFGNEGAGLPAAFSSLGQAVRIEQNDKVDSLNLSVAAAIGMYQFSEADNGQDIDRT